MAISPKKFQYLKEIFFSPLGEINFKSYFSYLGIFKDDTMFALYDHKNDRLYLRKSAQFYPDIIRTIPIHFFILYLLLLFTIFIYILIGFSLLSKNIKLQRPN